MQTRKHQQVITDKMKLLIVACCLMAVAMANPEFEAFKLKFDRKYKNPTEEAFRKKIFLDNKLTIDRHNQRFLDGKVTFTMGINQFADLTTQEFISTMNNLKMRKGPRDPEMEVQLGAQVNPASVDWRNSGCVTEVKDQGQCACTWAFSTTGSTEGANCLATGKLVSLSEQNLMDCSYKQGNSGCKGGLMDQAFEYIISNGGVDTEDRYPYRAESGVGVCNFSNKTIGGTVSKYQNIPTGSEPELETAVATFGPISVGIDASHNSFQLYSGGVYNEPSCSSTSLTIGVLAIGYGVDSTSGAAYWLVKNSLGTSWGMQGYIQMSKDANNQCGIATEASYPIV